MLAGRHMGADREFAYTLIMCTYFVIYCSALAALGVCRPPFPNLDVILGLFLGPFWQPLDHFVTPWVAMDSPWFASDDVAGQIFHKKWTCTSEQVAVIVMPADRKGPSGTRPWIPLLWRRWRKGHST